MEDAALVTAWATVGIAFVIGLGALATCLLIWRGLVEMRRSSDQRAKDRREAREADLRRHEDAMEADLRRHEEAMEADLRRHEEAMTALRALIARGQAVGDGSSAA